MEIDHEVISTNILRFPLIKEGQLSVTCESVCTQRTKPVQENGEMVNWTTRHDLSGTDWAIKLQIYSNNERNLGFLC